ncbi:MAG: hypothetical protein ABSG43_24270 [Solirubrobacteraceae bacterium]
MPRAGRGVGSAAWLLALALMAWAVVPVVVIALHASDSGLRFTGADGLIGADGVLGADQLQYLAWVRDAGGHGLVSNLFSLAPSGRVFLEPLFAVSGALWRLGVSLQLAYLLWKPIAAVALFAATFALARRMADSPGAGTAIVALSLFFYTPASWILNWGKLGSGSFRFQTYLVGWELLPANKLWGYAPSAIAIALLPVVLLATDRALTRRRAGGVAGAVGVASAAALLASWLHPWQGATLVLLLVGLAVWRRLRDWLVLAVPALAAALPPTYYELLAHGDPAWRLASSNEVVARVPLLALGAGLGPLALVAATGVRRPGEASLERMLLLWIAATLVTYFTVNAFPTHALQGLSIPLAVLAVRGWQRLQAPAVLGVVAVAAVSLPGLAWDAQKLLVSARSKIPQYYLTGGDARALDWLADRAPPGGVLAPTPFAIVVPSQTGRAVWVGHPYWSADYQARARRVDALFDGRMRPARARAFVAGTRATLLVSDCAHPSDLEDALRGLLRAVKRFGCARVYVLAPPTVTESIAQPTVTEGDRAAGKRTAGPTTSR